MSPVIRSPPALTPGVAASGLVVAERVTRRGLRPPAAEP